ncbi:MAG: YihY/virulence factor BrkB family protein [Defluviimonas denitrificans]|jgi:membrane protein
MMYRWGPNAQSARLPWFTPGSFLAAGLWAAASIAFSVYLANFGNYNRIYGSIGAVIALLMWFYISGYIVLLGAILNAEIVRQRSPQ